MSTGKDQSIAITATCTDDSITLRFDKPGTYRIWRMNGDGTWGAPIWERPLDREFVDQNDIEPGVAFEYKVVEMMTGAVAYILAGSKIPLIDSRGKLVLIVERSLQVELRTEIDQFIQDICGDGWAVLRHDVGNEWSPETIKGLIKAEWEKDKENVKAVVLLGAVPVKLSGPVNYDGHGPVMVAADGYYADMTGDWSGSPSIFPAKLQLSVGRIDFSAMTNFSNKSPSRSEVDLLRAYLAKNHAWRTGQMNVPSRSAIVDGFNDREFASNGWRNFPQLVNVIDEIPLNSFFESSFKDDYLMLWAGGGGQLVSMAGFGTSDDFATHECNFVFGMFLGSYFLGRWDSESAFLRSALASGKCLCAFGAGAPNVFLHRMALGGTIGESYLLGENNFVVYPPTGNAEDGLYSPSAPAGWPPGQVHQALMGDPTLTLFPVKPVRGLSGVAAGSILHLGWDAQEFNAGFHIYRSANANGPFMRLTAEPTSFLTFEVTDHFAGLIYLVRAVKLVTSPSGSFYQASCGVCWPATTTTQPQPPMPPIPGQIMSTAKFIDGDAQTQGGWIGEYGKDGQIIAGGAKWFPHYATAVLVGATEYVWSTESSDPRALQSGNAALRIAAAAYHAIGFTVEIKSDALLHRLALYFIDWDRAGRRQRVEILDGATDVLDRRDVLNFSEGVWLVYEFQGSIKLRLTKLAGPNAVLSAIMFDPVPTAPIPPTSADVRTLDVLCSTDRGATWRVVQTTDIDTTGTDGAMFKLAIR